MSFEICHCPRCKAGDLAPHEYHLDHRPMPSNYVCAACKAPLAMGYTCHVCGCEEADDAADGVKLAGPEATLEQVMNAVANMHALGVTPCAPTDADALLRELVECVNLNYSNGDLNSPKPHTDFRERWYAALRAARAHLDGVSVPG